MSTIEQAVEVDADKLMQFVFRAVDEVGASLNAALVVMGDKLGLYRALAGSRRAVAEQSWPSGPAPPSVTSANGSTRRLPAATSPMIPTAVATRCHRSRRSR